MTGAGQTSNDVVSRGVPPVSSAAAQRILIVRVGAMGDVLHALPAVAMLRRALPQAHLGWAVAPQWAALLRAEGTTGNDRRGMPLVDAIHTVETKLWNRRPFSFETLRSIRGLGRELRRAHYDIAIDLQGTMRSAAIARMSGAARVVGSSAPREGMARLLYRSTVPLTAVHVVDQASEIVSAALEAVHASKMTTLPLPAASRQTASSPLPRDAAAEAWWQQRRDALCGGRPFVLAAATAGWGAKQWPAARFAELAARLAAEGYTVLLNTTPGAVDTTTAEMLARVTAQSPQAAGHVQALPATLPQLIVATREATAVVAGDTGPLHLAELLGRPAVGLFGPTDPRRTGPRHGSICLRHASSTTDHRRHRETEHGLALLPVERVYDAIQELVDKAARGEASSDAR